MTLLLASASPRREQLLTDAGIAFVARPVVVDETPPPGMTPAQAVLAIAERKARAAADLSPGARILAADTIVVLDGRILGKPADRADARRMIASLSGRTHEVLTAVVFLETSSGRAKTAVVTSRVRFRALRTEEIERYAAGGEGLDKAGGYAIQGGAGAFVEEVVGPIDNVIGLPMATVRELLA